MDNKTILNESAFPSKGKGIHEDNQGMSLRDYFAAKAKDDFDDLHIAVQCIIVGRNPPEKSTGEWSISFDYSNIEYALWLADGRAKWKFMQADAMLKQKEL